MFIKINLPKENAMENRPNLTHKELREYLLALYYYTLGEIEKMISAHLGKETKVQDETSERLNLLFPFLADTVAKHMLTGNKDAPLLSHEDRDGFVKIFYQCMDIEVETMDEDEKTYIDAVVDQFLEQETSGDSPSSLNCEQAWKMVSASVQTSAINCVPLCDPLSLQSGLNESIRVKYPTKEHYMNKVRRSILIATKDPHAFSMQMKIIEIIADRAYGE
jgi:hypothetical protein